MKHLLLSLALSVTAVSAMAATPTLTGTCKVTSPEGVRFHDFSAGPNQKFKLGISEESSDGYAQFQVSVVNNIGNRQSANNWGHKVLLSIAPLGRIFANPPVLCPTTPADVRAACERENELSGSYGTNFNHFSERYNDGFVDDEAQITGLKSLTNGSKLTVKSNLTANTSVECKAVFNK